MKGVCVVSYFCKEDPPTPVHHLLCKRFNCMDSSVFTIARLGGNVVPETIIPSNSVCFLGSLLKANAIPGDPAPLDLQCEDTQGPQLVWGHRLSSEAQMSANSLPALCLGHTFGIEGFMYDKPGSTDQQEAPLLI